jgi:hypothetical protein
MFRIPTTFLIDRNGVLRVIELALDRGPWIAFQLNASPATFHAKK